MSSSIFGLMSTSGRKTGEFIAWLFSSGVIGVVGVSVPVDEDLD